MTLAILNTVDKATAVHQQLLKREPDAKVVLLHSRFRPADRANRVNEATSEVDPNGPGLIVVSTQVVEAGVDISATTLITEVAPWPALVQRAGRCNRDGNAAAASLVWFSAAKKPGEAAPYELADLHATAAALANLAGNDVDSATLGSQRVPTSQPIVGVLRRRDLVELFDTLPDLSGNDVDVSRFIRDADDLDVAVAWRDDVLASCGEKSMPGRDERCPVPVRSFREWLKRQRRAEGPQGVWRWNVLDRQWERARDADARPGATFIVDSSKGGYTPHTGWTPASSVSVSAVIGTEPAADDLGTGDDPVSVGDTWVSLVDHLADTLREADYLLSEVVPDLVEEQREAIRHAARLHDIGKSHDQFRKATRDIVETMSAKIESDVILAKTASSRPLRYERRGFRHELASALCLLGEGAVALAGVEEPDLAVYLVGAHHGRVRVGVRQLGERDPRAPAHEVLGIQEGDMLPALSVPGAELPASTLDVSITALGGGGRSWADRALELRDREDIGVFRLGFMEAIVRLADWRASAEPTPLEGGGDRG